MIFTRLYKLIRLFSLDIVAGAIAAQVFSSRVMGIELHRSYYIILALTVWLIYTADHLMDGIKSHGKSESETYNFFYKYKIPVILVFLLVLVFVFRLVVYRLDQRIIEFGIAPGVAVVVYLLMNRYYGNAPKWFFIKELWIALIYTMAIWGGPVIFAGDKVSTSQAMLITSFLLIILGNVLIYSIFEKEKDISEDNKSFVRDFGITAAVNLAIYTLISSIIFALVALIFLKVLLIYCLPLVLIPCIMLLILSFPTAFIKRKLFGIIADLIILLFFLAFLG
jgi:4-hydroxybenzoate polyprenyltransferase